MKEKKGSRKEEENAARLCHILGILHKWGIHTLGDFTRLAKEEIGARLGPEAVSLWKRANGKSTRLLKLVQPPESFAESFEFEYEVETVEPLLFMLRRFLEQLSRRLTGVYLVANELTLRIQFTNRHCYERLFKLPQPTNDVDLLFRMLHTHLEDFKSDHPIVAVSLDVEPIKPGQHQFGLFETTLRDPNQLYETLARLTALVGVDRVGTPVLEDTHRPDTFRLEPFTWHSNDTFTVTQPRRGASLRRFRPNFSACVLLEEDTPAHLHSAEISGIPCGQNGPFLASGNWWDEKVWERIEWDLHFSDQALLRCYRNANGWQVDGIYD